jgi:hypothetical protein
VAYKSNQDWIDFGWQERHGSTSAGGLCTDFSASDAKFFSNGFTTESEGFGDVI